MNNPTVIPEEKIFQRWDMLPEGLREALVSEKYGDILWKTCAAEHLSEEKTGEVARIASWVFLGFLHPEDIAREVQLSTGIHAEVANAIAAALHAKIFAPLRETLESSYAPPGTTPRYGEAPAGPVMLEDIRSMEDREGAPASPELPRGAQGASLSHGMEATLEKLRPSAAEEPFFKETPVALEALKEQGTRNKEQGEAFEVPPAFEMPPPERMSDAGRVISDEATRPSPLTTQNSFSPLATQPSPLETSPFILHEEAPAPSLPNVGDFSLDIRPEEFGPSEQELQKAPQADIEIGGATEGIRNKEQGTSEEEKESRIVHYGDLRTPLESVSGEGKVMSDEATLLSPLTPQHSSLDATPVPSPTFAAFNLSDLAGLDAPPPPPPAATAPEPDVPPPPPATQPSPLETSPKKQGFFARLFGRRGRGTLEPSDAQGSTLEATPEPDLPPPPPDEPPVPPLPPATGADTINLDSFKS
ncbi:MAG: hypothetical protein HYW65_01845 [Candidatus Liptonbacteria bacterium]|nr:hypothetical protein [Candidatus Liptonbacteria bacterium]